MVYFGPEMDFNTGLMQGDLNDPDLAALRARCRANGVKILGALGGQCDDADVGGHLELAGRVPSGLIHQDNGMGTRRDDKGYFGEVQGHGVGIAEG